MKQPILTILVIISVITYGQKPKSVDSYTFINNEKRAENFGNIIFAPGKISEAGTFNNTNSQEQLSQAEINDEVSGDSAILPPCTGSLMPVVEIQINNTACNSDDYGSTTGYTICGARIINYLNSSGNKNFKGGLPVEIRNPAGLAQNLLFSVDSTKAGVASLFVNLPQNGSFKTFYIKGNLLDTIDKASIIEIATSTTCSDVVVARKALMIGPNPIPAGLAHVEIEVGSISTLDDYLTWSPKLCRIKWSNGVQDSLIALRNLTKHPSYVGPPSSFIIDSSSSVLNIQLQNMPGTDHLRFAGDTLATGTTAKNSTLPLTLSNDGSWVYFYMAGNFNNASIYDKDAVMQVTDSATGLLLAREGVMVRIRKNANNFTIAERDRFLEALNKVSLTYADYINFVRTHARDNNSLAMSNIATRQAHAGSAFLPWHRIFTLHLERLLQAADPSVALPYWDFGANAPNVFDQNFMGTNSNGNLAKFASTCPLVSWTLPGENVPTGVQRKTPYGSNGHLTTASETAVLGLGAPTYSFSAFKAMETDYHNPAHAKSGSTSWLLPLNTSVRDPLFFLLHCNVDRVWAKWQWMRNRYNTTDTVSYDLQGSFYAPAPGVKSPSAKLNRTLGQYADDTVWPWDNVTGGASGSAAERPQLAIITPFPVTLGGALPGSKPTIKSVIDYLGITASSPGSDLGFGYDDYFPYP